VKHLRDNKRINHINRLIASVINPEYEDAIQDVWLKILENGKIPTDEAILNITRETKRRAGSEVIQRQYIETSLDEPINKHSDALNPRTFQDILGNGDTNTLADLNDYEGDDDKTSRIEMMLLQLFIVGSYGECLYCHRHAKLDFYGICQECATGFVEDSDVTHSHIFCFCPICDNPMGYFEQGELRRSLYRYCSRNCAGKASNMPISERPYIKIDPQGMLRCVLFGIYHPKYSYIRHGIKPNQTLKGQLKRTIKYINDIEQGLIKCPG